MEGMKQNLTGTRDDPPPPPPPPQATTQALAGVRDLSPLFSGRELRKKKVLGGSETVEARYDPSKQPKIRVFLPNDILPKNSPNFLAIDLMTSQNKTTHSHQFHCIHS